MDRSPSEEREQEEEQEEEEDQEEEKQELGMAAMKDAHVFLLLRGVRVKHLGPPTLAVRTFLALQRWRSPCSPSLTQTGGRPARQLLPAAAPQG